MHNPFEYSEKEYVAHLLSKLRAVDQHWLDGDLEKEQSGEQRKSVDLVNHHRKAAIEVKDDCIAQPEVVDDTFGGGFSYDGHRLNKQFRDDIYGANRKFREYPEYKTILLVRTNLMAQLVKTSIEGLHVFSKTRVREIHNEPPLGNWSISPGLVYKGRKNKHNKKEVGSFIIHNESGYHYFSNVFASEARKIDLEYCLEITGLKIYGL